MAERLRVREQPDGELRRSNFRQTVCGAAGFVLGKANQDIQAPGVMHVVAIERGNTHRSEIRHELTLDYDAASGSSNFSSGR
jgi:hypothetical protein